MSFFYEVKDVLGDSYVWIDFDSDKESFSLDDYGDVIFVKNRQGEDVLLFTKQIVSITYKQKQPNLRPLSELYSVDPDLLKEKLNNLPNIYLLTTSLRDEDEKLKKYFISLLNGENQKHFKSADKDFFVSEEETKRTKEKLLIHLSDL